MLAQSRYSVATLSVNITANIAGLPVKWNGRPFASTTCFTPAWTLRPVAWTVSMASVSRRIWRVLRAADAAIRLPAYVPPWLTLSGRTLMTSSLPPKAAAG